MQPAADIVERGAEGCQRLRLFVDVAKAKMAGAAAAQVNSLYNTACYNL
jgi:hypothetical protein